MTESARTNLELQIHVGSCVIWRQHGADGERNFFFKKRGKKAKAGAKAREAMQTYVKTKNKVVDPTRSVAAVDTGMYLVGLNLFPALLGIL